VALPISFLPVSMIISALWTLLMTAIGGALLPAPG
jgi:hypothetical protein